MLLEFTTGGFGLTGFLSTFKTEKQHCSGFFFNLPVESLPRQRQICDQGYSRWIFRQNLEDILSSSLLALLFSYLLFFRTISSYHCSRNLNPYFCSLDCHGVLVPSNPSKGLLHVCR